VLIRSSILTAAVLLWSAGSALPDTIFFDDFNRANSNTVGNGWQEVGGCRHCPPFSIFQMVKA
jgi:hypothetical protein